MDYIVEKATHSRILPYFSHYSFIYSYTSSVSSFSFMSILKAIMGDFYILNANKAFSADCSTVTKFANDKELNYILQLESVSFFMVSGVFIP